MATLTTSLKACPKRVINYQTYVKTGEKEWTLNLKRGLPAPTNQHPPTYTAMIISKKKKSHLHFKTQVLITFLFILMAYALHCSLQF